MVESDSREEGGNGRWRIIFVGFAVALAAAYREKSLLTVAACACVAVFITERVIGLFG